MADFIFERDQMTVIVIRIPRRLWDRFEANHAHFGLAIQSVREGVVDLLAARVMHTGWVDQGDPFWHDNVG